MITCPFPAFVSCFLGQRSGATWENAGIGRGTGVISVSFLPLSSFSFQEEELRIGTYFPRREEVVPKLQAPPPPPPFRSKRRKAKQLPRNGSPCPNYPIGRRGRLESSFYSSWRILATRTWTARLPWRLCTIRSSDIGRWLNALQTGLQSTVMWPLAFS